MRLVNALLLFLCLAFVACPSLGKAYNQFTSIEEIKNRFTATIAADSDAYNVCEFVVKVPTNTYLNLLFSKIPPSPQANLLSSHIEIRKQEASSGIDLSIYQVETASEKIAEHIFLSLLVQPSGTIADGKVLTKYAVRLEGESIFVISTRSILNTSAASFFRSFID